MYPEFSHAFVGFKQQNRIVPVFVQLTHRSQAQI